MDLMISVVLEISPSLEFYKITLSSYDLTITKTLQLIKGESAYWINHERLLRSKFEWADEYFAVSVSESILDNVRAYIDTQEEHHRKRTFGEEVGEFMRQYRLERQG